jgi:DNA-binding transcriptional regulator YiaG
MPAETDAETEGLNLVLLRSLLANGGGRRLRERANLSRSELARMVGTTEVSIWRWEGSHRRPRGPLAQKYLAALAKVADLIEATGE